MPIDQQTLELIRQNSPQLTKLELGGLELQDSDLLELSDALEFNTAVLSIDLCDNNIVDKRLEFLLTLKFGKAFKVDLSDNLITANGWRYFAEHNKQFIDLSVTGSLLEDDAATALGRSKCLRSLDLSSNNIADLGAEQLAANGSIVELFLRGNKISSVGANKLLSNPRFVLLHLHRNHITTLDDKTLSANTTLRSLGLDDNPLTKDTILAVVQRLSLQSLSLARLGLGDDFASVLAQSLTLETVFLAGNKFTDEGAEILCANPRLTTISLQQNQLKKCSSSRMSRVVKPVVAKTEADKEEPSMPMRP